jgi:Domain of unknown function (DUF1707)
MATRSDMRVGDADREASAASLREHYAQGRLSLEEFNERIDAVFAASTQGELDRITSDLPHVRTPSVPLPESAVRGGPYRGGGGGRRGSQRRTGVAGGLAAMLAAIVTLGLCLIVLAPSLLNLRLGWLPGRFSILFIGLMIVRGLFRRIFGGRGGWGRGPGRRSGRPW